MKNIMKFVCLAALCGSMAACIAEMPSKGSNGGSEEGGTTRVTFRLRTPMPSRVGTRAIDTSYENGIDNITVFTFRSTSEGYVGVKAIGIDEFEENGREVTFSLDLASEGIPIKLIIMANLTEMSAQGIDGMDISAYSDDGLCSSAFLDLDDVLTIQKPLMPMAGEVILTPVNGKFVSPPTVDFVRSVARADVNLALTGDSKPFEPTEVWVFRATDNIQVAPNRAAFDDPDEQNTIVAPSIISTSSWTQPYSVAVGVPVSGAGLFANAYVTESAGATTHDEQLAATCLVVGGYYDGDSTKTLYYRMDFDSGEAGHPFGQILRNWIYDFDIVEVTGPGRDTKEEAATADDMTMVTELTPWEVDGGDYYLGNEPFDYLKVTESDLDFEPAPGQAISFDVVSTMPFTIVERESGSVDNFGYTTAPYPEAGQYSQKIVVTTKHYNLMDSGSDNTAFLDISVNGNPVTTVSLVQHQPVFRSGKTVNVYSVGNSGFLMGLSDVSSLPVPQTEALKPLLTNTAAFGPGAPVKVAGFTFGNDPTGQLFTVAANAGALADVLENVDILFLSYGYDPAAANCDVIIEWLRDPYHVLFMSCEVVDSIVDDILEKPTNNIMRTRLTSSGYLPYSLTWNDSGLLGGLLTDPRAMFPATIPTGYDRQFFTGPFANITASGTNTFAGATDGSIMGYVDTSVGSFAGTGVVPLLNIAQSHIQVLPPATIWESTKNMLLGVDPTYRIVYVGDSDMFSTSALASGTVTSPTTNPYNSLVANLAAWAAMVASSEIVIANN